MECKFHKNKKRTTFDLLYKEDPDFVCLQEIKSSNDAFPTKDFKGLNYFSYVNGMPSYNGVGILSKEKVESTYSHIFCKQNDSRHIEVKYKGLRIHSLYVPAGGEYQTLLLIKSLSINLNF